VDIRKEILYPQIQGVTTYKDHHNLVSLALITMILGTRIEEEEANQATRTTKEHKPIFSQVLRTRIELGTLI
jgi:hypothetical protein